MRAVTRGPYPGAFTFAGDRKLLVWKASVVPARGGNHTPGTIISIDPLQVACGKDVLEITSGQSEQGLFVRGAANWPANWG